MITAMFIARIGAVVHFFGENLAYDDSFGTQLKRPETRGMRGRKWVVFLDGTE